MNDDCGRPSLDGKRCILPEGHPTLLHHIGDDGSSWSEESVIEGAGERIAFLESTNAALREALEEAERALVEERERYFRELRDRAATAAIQGFIAAGAEHGSTSWERYAEMATFVAYALVDELYPEEVRDE